MQGGSGAGLPALGVLAGIWAVVPPYVVLFGELAVRSSVEVVDHVLPGAVVVTVALIAHLRLRVKAASPMLLLVCGLVITLAGFWMLSTHIGLISQARQGIAPWAVVIWHGLPGIALTVLGVVWTIRFWATDDAGVHEASER